MKWRLWEGYDNIQAALGEEPLSLLCLERLRDTMATKEMIVKFQLATLLTRGSLGKTPQTIRCTRAYSADPGLTITHTHTSARTQRRAPGRWGENEIRFGERSLIEGSESMAGWGLRETRE